VNQALLGRFALARLARLGFRFVFNGTWGVGGVLSIRLRTSSAGLLRDSVMASQPFTGSFTVHST
jgi:hypothetical protein